MPRPQREEELHEFCFFTAPAGDGAGGPVGQFYEFCMEDCESRQAWLSK